MMYGIKQVLKYALGRDIAGRTLAVRPDDTFIVSYPRSGNTWTRFLVANLLHPQEPATFVNIGQLVPDAEVRSSRSMRGIPSPRMIKSHSYFDPRYPRVIYIVRDPRDVALSEYDLLRKYLHIEDSYARERFIGDFVAGTGPLISAGWGTWGENVASWAFARGARPGFLLLQYEDLKARPEQELRRIAEFLGIDATPELLQNRSRSQFGRPHAGGGKDAGPKTGVRPSTRTSAAISHSSARRRWADGRRTCGRNRWRRSNRRGGASWHSWDMSWSGAKRRV